ncbi:MAG: hypothetical protein CFE45_13785, partial [Burkholderiales bacterium PBB5]
MSLLTPFIVLIERRLLRPLVLALASALVLVVGLGAHAGGQGKHRKTAGDLSVAINSPIAPDHRWVKHRNALRMVDALIVTDGKDPQMTALRAHVELLGGTVNARFASMQALSVTVPARAIKALDDRTDVESISPNRSTRRAVSTLEKVVGANAPAVRTTTGLTATGLDGTGVGIAILDSGVMASHQHLANGLGVSRVLRQVDLVGKSTAAYNAAGYAPDSLDRNIFETSINSGSALAPDPYGHGSHVAAVAAGNGRSLPVLDTTGVAPGANILDVRVLGSDGSGTVADVLAGLDWVLYNATKYNIRVVNLSIASSSTESWVTDPLARAARVVTAAGITVVAAAGNFGQLSGATTYGTIGSPGHDPSVITVGS